MEPESFTKALQRAFSIRNTKALRKCQKCSKKDSGCHWMNCDKHKVK